MKPSGSGQQECVVLRMTVDMKERIKNNLKAWCFILKRVGLCGAMLLLTGCAGMQAYKEGNELLAQGKTDEGLAKLEEAVALEPRNAEYRIALSFGRTSVINDLVKKAEVARREGRLTDAEKGYQQVLLMDPNHMLAQQGQKAVVTERQHRQAVADARKLFENGGEPEQEVALEKLRGVLSENPGQKDAQALRAQINALRAQAVEPETRLAEAYRKPITLEFRDAPLKAIFDVIAKVADINFFFDKDIRPDLKATILVKNSSIEDAIRVLLVTNQLEQKILNDNSILIYPNTPQKLKDYQTLMVRTFYLANADPKAVSNTIKTIVKTKDLVVDERLGLLIMRDTPEAIRMAERIIAMQDLSDPEVMLEVEVMEIKRSRLMELGIQWPGQVGLTPLPSTSGESKSGTLTLDDLLNLNRKRIEAAVGPTLVNARKEDQDGNILANPRIRVRNKEKAKIMIGDRVPAITTTSTSTGFVSESVNYIDVGLKLEVEPNIYLDEEVAIKVNLEVSNLVREIKSSSGTLSYQIGTREAATILRLKDGETQILAGLINDEDRSAANKVPGIGELPVLGRLFGSQKDDTQRSEILLSITPRIVRSIRRPDLLEAEFESGTEGSIGTQPLRLRTVKPSGEGKAGGERNKEGSQTAAAGGSLTGGVKSAVNPEMPAVAGAGNSPDTANVTSAGAVVPGGLNIAWSAPAEIRVGERFSAVLQLSSQEALRSLPLLVGFDPAVLRVASVEEGDFFKQGNAQTNFSQRVDALQGKAFIALVRQSAGGSESGVNGVGRAVTVNFVAVKAAPETRIQLLSVSPEPAPAVMPGIPVDHLLRIVP